MPPNSILAMLRADPRFAALHAHVPPIRLFSALRVDRDELAHSQLLATLLNPRTHAGAETMLRALLSQIAERTDAPAQTVIAIRSLPAKWQPIWVHRELHSVDVVVDLLAPGGLVVGIENKIDAVEGGEQLSRYQEALGNRFPGRPALMLFLTPSGRAARTAAPKHRVPCLSLSYSDVLAAIEVTRQSTTRLRDANALELVALQIREEIMGEPDEICKLVRELWRDHPEAMRLLLAHRPQLKDIRDVYQVGIKKSFPQVEFQYYQSRGELSEIKFWVPEWAAKFPFCFMIYTDDNQLSARVLIFRDNFNQNANALTKWASKVNEANPGLIDEDFRALPGWSAWRRVLKEEDWPVSSVILVTGSDNDTAQVAVERILALVDILRPHIPAK